MYTHSGSAEVELGSWHRGHAYFQANISVADHGSSVCHSETA